MAPPCDDEGIPVLTTSQEISHAQLGSSAMVICNWVHASLRVPTERVEEVGVYKRIY